MLFLSISDKSCIFQQYSSITLTYLNFKLEEVRKGCYMNMCIYVYTVYITRTDPVLYACGDNKVFAEQSGLQIYRGIRSEL